MMEIETALIAFARWVIEEHRETFADVDGGAIQDKLVELGLIVPIAVNEPCGENCACAEYVDEWPHHCLRLKEGVKA
jgi:hypothetical protein